MKLDDSNVVQPDILVICDKDKIDDKRCNGAPDLIIEVTSSNRDHDFMNKLYLYERFGVKEYWIVDPEYQKSVVYLFENKNNINIYSFDQDIAIEIFNNELKINISELI